jgi:hypothetical protein
MKFSRGVVATNVFLGTDDPAPTIAPSKTIPFRHVLDGMKPYLTLGQGLGGEVAILFSHTPTPISNFVFFSHPLNPLLTYPLPPSFSPSSSF